MSLSSKGFGYYLSAEQGPVKELREPNPEMFTFAPQDQCIFIKDYIFVG